MVSRLGQASSITIMNTSSKRQCLNVVVLYACSGSYGHRVLAENYCALLRSVGVDAVAVDVFEKEGRRQFHRWLSLYFSLLKSAPRLWRVLYCGWTYLPIIDLIRRQVLPRRFTKTQAFLRSTRPDLILSTHPIGTAIADFLKRRQALNSQLWVAFSDWHTQKFWMFPNVEHYLVPIKGQQDTLMNSGVPADNVSVVGMLLRGTYYHERQTRESARLALHIKAGAKVVLIMAGGKGWALEEIIDGVRHLPVQRIVIAGSKSRKREIKEYIRRNEYGGEWHVVGWVDPIRYLLASDVVIAKPGGLTTAEVLHLRRPLILCGAMPGHEEENRRVLSDIGVCWASTTEELPSLVSQLFSKPESVFSKLQAIERNLCTATSPDLVRETLKRVDRIE